MLMTSSSSSLFHDHSALLYIWLFPLQNSTLSWSFVRGKLTPSYVQLISSFKWLRSTGAARFLIPWFVLTVEFISIVLSATVTKHFRRCKACVLANRYAHWMQRKALLVTHARTLTSTWMSVIIALNFQTSSRVEILFLLVNWTMLFVSLTMMSSVLKYMGSWKAKQNDPVSSILGRVNVPHNMPAMAWIRSPAFRIPLYVSIVRKP